MVAPEVQVDAEPVTDCRMIKSTSKVLRSKRRLLSFLLKKRIEGESIKINLMSFIDDIKNSVTIDDSLVNCQKHPEQRLISLVGTIQRSSFTSTFEKDFIEELIDQELRFDLLKISKLTCNPTHGTESVFTHRFSIHIILQDNTTMPCDYIWRRLRRDTFEYEDGRRIFFKQP